MLIGLSGPMAAGKNLAGEILEKLGCAVIDADETAHIALENTKQQVLTAFQPEAVRPLSDSLKMPLSRSQDRNRYVHHSRSAQFRTD